MDVRFKVCKFPVNITMVSPIGIMNDGQDEKYVVYDWKAAEYFEYADGDLLPIEEFSREDIIGFVSGLRFESNPAKRGKRAIDGCKPKRHTVTLDNQTVDICRELGDGNLSLGIRRLAKEKMMEV